MFHHCATSSTDGSWSRATRATAQQKAQLPEGLFDALEERRKAAEDNGGPVPFTITGEQWWVEPNNFGRYRFRLVHPSGMFGVTTSTKLPQFYIQPCAEFLHGLGSVRCSATSIRLVSLSRRIRLIGRSLRSTCSAMSRVRT